MHTHAHSVYSDRKSVHARVGPIFRKSFVNKCHFHRLFRKGGNTSYTCAVNIIHAGSEPVCTCTPMYTTPIFWNDCFFSRTYWIGSKSSNWLGYLASFWLDWSFILIICAHVNLASDTLPPSMLSSMSLLAELKVSIHSLKRKKTCVEVSGATLD